MSPRRPPAPADTAPPSKTRRKQESHALQALGEALIALRPDELAAMDLPAPLREAVETARAMKAHGALRRQKQYIGKLMRRLDPEPLRAALEARHALSAAETRRFHLAEGWRERLLAEGEGAVPACAEATGTEPGRLAGLTRRARAAAGDAERKQAARRLFRYLHRAIEGAGDPD